MSLTVVLTLKGREEFTYRWMSYMDGLKFPYKILIADGGDDQNLESHLREYRNYPNLDYEYIRYPFDSSLEDYYQKLYDVLTRVKTKYTLHADNDDFYLLDKIENHLTFLDENLDYVATRGSLVNLELVNRNYEPISSPTGHAYLARYVFSEPIVADSSLERIKLLCEGMAKFDYYSNWYSITRSDALVSIWSQLVTLKIKEVIVLEILSHVMLVTAGKVRITSDAFYFRQSHTSSFGDTLVQNNEFVERCLAKNGLSEFAFALDNFQILNNTEENEIALRSIAYWFNEFIFNINDSKRNDFRKTIARFLRRIKPTRQLLFAFNKFRSNHNYSMKNSNDFLSKYIITNLTIGNR